MVEEKVSHQKPPKPLDKCHIKVERCFYRFLDWDSCVASLKPLIDGLIHCDIIKDDSYKITGPWDVTQSFRPKKEGPLLKVEIYDRMENPSDSKANDKPTRGKTYRVDGED